MTDWSAEDIAALKAGGRDAGEAARQLEVLRGPRPVVRLDRPATVGDGIRRLDDALAGELEAAHEAAQREGRVGSFVPASGAATRMCQELLRARQEGYTFGDTDAEGSPKVRDVLLHAPDLAVWPDLQAHGAREDDARSILEAMFGPTGIALHELPKGLVPFHAAPEGARTAFDEHLIEAVRLGRDRDGVVRAHFTVGAEHLQAFQARLEQARRRVEPRMDVRFEVGFSVQDPSTDTIASDDQGRPFRLADGAFLFRPGGHGALVRNLDALGGDVVLVKNIDNVVPEDLRGPNLPWRKRLAGLLVTLQGRAHALVRRLRRGEAVDEARRFVHHELGADLPADAAALIERLDRPWRVCGMVRNEGQPGGGPFWAASPDGVTLQIVESVQVDTADAEQAALLSSSTHFNPVDMALGVRDADGRPHDLTRFTDPRAVIVTEKSHEGRTLRALEHPGLWNGGMARWNTIFVEIPAYTFQPVKTMADLLSCGHGGPLC